MVKVRSRYSPRSRHSPRSRSRYSPRSRSSPRRKQRMVYSRLGRKMSPVIVEREKLKKGSLTRLGYHMKSPVASRHKALRRSVNKYGKASTIWKLNIQRTYRKRSDPKLAKSIERDISFVRKLQD